MPASEHEELLRRYITEVWDEGDPEAVARFAADDYLRHRSPVTAPLDLAAQIERLKGFRQAFPDITIEVVDVAADGDLIAFRATLRGTHDGEFLGIPATGRTVTVGLVDFIRVEDGKFAEQWGGPDMHDLLTQLGAKLS
jgi:steroid delta-isomerase-like uncharacterized protein